MKTFLVDAKEPEVRRGYWHAVGVVVAESAEQAKHAALIGSLMDPKTAIIEVVEITDNKFHIIRRG